MTIITIDDVIARQSELARIIEAFTTQATATKVLIVAEAAIELRPGEHYAGAVLAEDGTVKHHLVLMAPRPDGHLEWQDAMAWASGVGGSLPDLQEQALLFANCKRHLKAEWHWSSQPHETNASYAWYCYFTNGTQDTSPKSFQGCAVAVRRFP